MLTAGAFSPHGSWGPRARAPKEPGRKRVVSFLLWSQAAQRTGQGTRAPPLNGASVKVHCKRNIGSGMYCFEIYNMPQERRGTGHGEQPSDGLSHDKAATVLALPCPSDLSVHICGNPVCLNQQAFRQIPRPVSKCRPCRCNSGSEGRGCGGKECLH